MYHFWETWDDQHRVTFDGPNRLIYVAYGVTSLDIKTHVYSDWKEWVQNYDNSKYLSAIRTIGGDPLGDNLYAGDIYFLINGWRIIVDLTKVRITGALYSDDYETAYWTTEPVTENLIPQYPTTVAQLVQTVEIPMPVVTGDLSTVPTQVWNALLAGHMLPNTFGKAIQDLPTAAENADATWSKPISTLTDKTTIGGFLVKCILTVPKYLGLK